MHTVRYNVQLALRGSNNVCAYAKGSRRVFSRSCARSRGALPVFLEPSTPQLSTLLSTFNRSILAPHHFTKEQQQLVYKQANKAKLEAEPVEITLGDVTIPLEHINRSHLPNRWKVYSSIVRDSKTEQDYENVVRVLEGFHDAGIDIGATRQAFTVRRLNLHGKQHLVLKALQKVNATGLSLKEYEVLRPVLLGIYDIAAKATWEKEATLKALKMAQQVTALLETPEHHSKPSRGDMVSEQDHRGNPFVIALPTELAAILAEKHGGPADEVEKLARRLISAMKQDDYNTKLDSISADSTKTEANFSNTYSQMVFYYALISSLFPIRHIVDAIRKSKRVLGTNMPLAEEAQQFESRGLQVFKEGLIGAERLWSRHGKPHSNSYITRLKENFVA